MANIIIRKNSRDRAYEQARYDNTMKKMETREIKKIQSGKRSKNAGYSEPGWNMGLDAYVKDKEHYNKLVKEQKVKDSRFDHA